MPPIFSSFDEAWRWFLDGGELVPLAEQRERFTRGRAQFLSFEAPLAGSPVADEAAAVQDELAGIPGLAPWPLDLLHISLRGVGWQVIEKSRPDEVLRQEVGSIAERAARRLRGLGPIDVVVGRVNVLPDALILEVHESPGLVEARRRLEEAAGADAFGHSAATYLPHVTIGTFREGAATPALREMLALLRERPPVPVELRRLELARYWFTGLDPADDPERDTVRSYVLR
ncbi:MAG TPA: 2'-5' RNA ligase family protein [Dehalococcoidia bacterium]|nr:2'-5' RNA ligase family protein [Dehalococcoidia bacterium]